MATLIVNTEMDVVIEDRQLNYYLDRKKMTLEEFMNNNEAIRMFILDHFETLHVDCFVMRVKKEKRS